MEIPYVNMLRNINLRKMELEIPYIICAMLFAVFVGFTAGWVSAKEEDEKKK